VHNQIEKKRKKHKNINFMFFLFNIIMHDFLKIKFSLVSFFLLFCPFFVFYRLLYVNIQLSGKKKKEIIYYQHFNDFTMGVYQ